MSEFAIPAVGRTMSTIHRSNIPIMPTIANQIKNKGISMVLLHSPKSGKLIDDDIFSVKIHVILLP